jgi:hypothetical protein
LLAHIGTLPARTSLAAALGDESERVSAYYLCPLSNLRKIVETGIHSNTGAPNERTDLSGVGVQDRRDAEVWLTNDVHSQRKRVHTCVNLFWNPLNWTCRAFQHHALLRETAEENPDSGVLCILELNVGAMLSDETYYWTTSPRNIASSSFASFTKAIITGETTNDRGEPYFDWNGIFSYGTTSDAQLNRKRSAELIVFHDPRFQDPQVSAPLPVTLVKRILIPDAAIRQLTPAQDEFLDRTGFPRKAFPANAYPPVFFRKDDLLWPERQFGSNLARLKDRDAAVFDKLNAAISAVNEFEQQNPALTPIPAQFTKPEQASGKHGSAHTARVMYWAAYLAQYLPDAERQHIMLPLLSAAAIHDVCRESDGEDEVHGATAASREREKIAGLVSDGALVTSCLEAVRSHCLKDTDCREPGIVWQILKDADAIDRGRFGKPDQTNGCQSSVLRTETLRGASGTNILWMGYYLAQMTRHFDPGIAPCQNLTETLVNCLYTAFPRRTQNESR